ncbi:MAG: heavy-metal-associated domain-containing protein [Nocardia sp.]|nr:heavy-metal-associated domain-containing protein [Nocardia sp.]
MTTRRENPTAPAASGDTYDRRAASRILAELAQPGLFASATAPGPATFTVTASALRPEPDSHLTLSQRLYMESFMRPCRADQVTTATHRVSWTDSDGIPGIGHFRRGGLGPIVPVAAREAVLALWHSLDTDPALAQRIRALDPADRAILAATTTDRQPLEILRVGIEATGRALTQHALLAEHTPYRDPAEFAHRMRDSQIFAAVATRWYWEQQASTYRRGMIAADLTCRPDGSLRYSADTIALQRTMKDATIRDAHEVMTRATTTEGLSVADAITKYHDDLDLISRQYALLPAGERPACLAAVPHRLGGAHDSLLAEVTDRFVDLFTQIVADITIVEVPEAEYRDTAADHVFYVPDMNCRHCVRTIGAVLESMRIPVHEVDLISKRVRAEFRSPRNRHRAFEALRDGGYTPTLAAPDTTG